MYLKFRFNWGATVLLYPAPEVGVAYTKLRGHCTAIAMVITSVWLDYLIRGNERGTLGI